MEEEKVPQEQESEEVKASEDKEEASEKEAESEKETSEEPKEDSEERKMYKAVCSECGKECEVPFEPEEGKPVKCKECYIKSRPKRRFGGNRRFDRGPRKMYPAKCGKCGKDCEVPFEPKGDKPVLCQECYRESKGFA